MARCPGARILRALDAAGLLRVLQRVDRSFERARQAFRAVNGDGYLVDLIKPLRVPPWSDEAMRLADDPSDGDAVEIAGRQWPESAPAFEATAIDLRGEAARLVTVDPRIFAAHKHWLVGQPDREPIKCRRDAAQAAAVASLIATHLAHLPFEAADLRMLPRRCSPPITKPERPQRLTRQSGSRRGRIVAGGNRSCGARLGLAPRLTRFGRIGACRSSQQPSNT